MKPDQRAKIISAKRQDAGRPLRLWCKDDWKAFPVYRVPVEGLVLNVDNRRFGAERKLMEERLGRALDPENNPIDERSVISILLDTNLDVDGDEVKGTPTKSYEALRKDWERRRQEAPFWIRPDGVVRNGNRRLAMLKRLREEGGIEGTEWVEAIILPYEEIDEHDVFDMEQREQLTEEFKVRYTDINLLLTLREAAEDRGVDWADPESLERVAGELQHITEGDKGYALVQLQAIRAMDAYLADMGAPGQHQKLFRQVERFRDVGKNLAKIEEEYPDDAEDMLRLMFAAIHAGNPHNDIRALRRLFLEDKDRYTRLLKEVDKVEEKWSTEARPTLEDPPVASDGEDSDSDAEPPGPVIANYPAERVRSIVKNAIDALTASQLDIVSVLRQALNRLEQADPDKLLEGLRGEDAQAVREQVMAVISWADDARGVLDAGVGRERPKKPSQRTASARQSPKRPRSARKSK